MKFIKWGAVLIGIYLVVGSKNSGPLAGSASTGASNLVKAFQGR